LAASLLVAACVVGMTGCRERDPENARTRAPTVSAIGAGFPASASAPKPVANLAPALDLDEARKANSAMAFSSQPIEAALPVFDKMLDAHAPANDPSLECLTAAVYYEAGGESLQGGRAVAQVVLNRVRHPSFPNSVCAVVYQGANRRTGCQFTFTCDGSLARKPAARPWRRAEQIARQALSGVVEPSVGLATHYHADWVFPYWAPSLRKLVRVGPHIFYTWPGAWGRRLAFSQRPAWGEQAASAQTGAALAGAPAVDGVDPIVGQARSPLVADAAVGTIVAAPTLGDRSAPRPLADERAGTLVVDGRK
jgi:spore germination cell wall hydrolase CwlJ-like protein